MNVEEAVNTGSLALRSARGVGNFLSENKNGIALAIA